MQKRMTSSFNRKRRDHLLVTVIWVMTAWLFSNLVYAQSAKVREFSLQSAQEFAVEYSYDSRRSQLDILTAQKKLRETLYSGFPQINSAINYMNNLELATVLIPNFFEGKFEEKIPVQFGTQHNANVSFNVNQLLFSGSYFVGLKTSKIFRQLADQNYERTQLNVLE
ncbi:MAG: TolC family protein, partial [Candidatus Aminicenantes bacterium]|nr:TolC family protein [Candidatus Aminicenantes bacterium]